MLLKKYTCFFVFMRKSLFCASTETSLALFYDSSTEYLSKISLGGMFESVSHYLNIEAHKHSIGIHSSAQDIYTNSVKEMVRLRDNWTLNIC